MREINLKQRGFGRFSHQSSRQKIYMISERADNALIKKCVKSLAVSELNRTSTLLVASSGLRPNNTCGSFFLQHFLILLKQMDLKYSNHKARWVYSYCIVLNYIVC